MRSGWLAADRFLRNLDWCQKARARPFLLAWELWMKMLHLDLASLAVERRSERSYPARSPGSLPVLWCLKREDALHVLVALACA